MPASVPRFGRDSFFVVVITPLRSAAALTADGSGADKVPRPTTGGGERIVRTGRILGRDEPPRTPPATPRRRTRAGALCAGARPRTGTPRRVPRRRRRKGGGREGSRGLERPSRTGPTTLGGRRHLRHDGGGLTFAVGKRLGDGL